MLTSYKNNPKLKRDFLREVKKHREQDMIVQGTYGEENGHWRGCAVACSLRSLAILNGEELREEYNNHKRYETDLGIPKWLARLEDQIFEGLPKEDALKWPEQFASAIPVGVNLEPVKWHFCVFLMKENIARVEKLEIDEKLKKQVVDAIKGVLAVHEKAIETGKWDASAARSADSATLAAHSADSATLAAHSARSATLATRSARSARSATLAAHSAYSATLAARSAYSATLAAHSARSATLAAHSAYSAHSAAHSAYSAAYKRYAEALIKLLKEA